MVVVLGLGVGAWLVLFWDRPPGHGALAARLDRVGLPDDLRRTGEERIGNRLCWAECPILVRDFLVSESSIEEAAGAFERTLGRQGFEMVAGPPRAIETASFQGLAAERDDEVLCVELTTGVPTLTSEERLAEGQVGVRLLIGEFDGFECRGLQD